MKSRDESFPPTKLLVSDLVPGTCTKISRCLIDLLKWYMENSEDNTSQQKLSGMNYGGDSNISPDLWVLESLHVNCFLGWEPLGLEVMLSCFWSGVPHLASGTPCCWAALGGGCRLSRRWRGARARPQRCSLHEAVEPTGPLPSSLARWCSWGFSSSERPPTLLLHLLNTPSRRFSKRFAFDDIIEAVRCPFLFPDTLTGRRRV